MKASDQSSNWRAVWRLMGRMLLRDWRAGELNVLGVALVLAVASLTSVGFLADRVEQALTLESNQLLGGDLLLTADHPWDDAIARGAVSRGLSLARSVSFPSMVSAGEGEAATIVLADIKAVSDNYPLRGILRAAPALNQADADIRRAPAPGEVWPDERLASTLAVPVGSRVTLGVSTPRIGQVLTREPDRGMNVMALAPRLMINLADLPATGLIQMGSRVNYRLHIAGKADALEDYRHWLTQQLGRGERVESLDNARPEVRNLLERAQRFLRLAALLSLVLAAIAVALSAERFMRRHLDACAVMRCMGASENQILIIHAGEFIGFGVLATVLGSLLGYLVQYVLLGFLAELLFPELPAASLLPWMHGLLVGVVLLAGFALPPLLRLKRVPTVRVLRREFGDELGSSILGYGGGALALALVLLWIAGDLRLGALVLGGFTLAIGIYALAAQGLLVLLTALRPAGGGYGWRHGIANLLRHRRATLVQTVALGLGLTALLLLTVARGDLLSNWQKKTPADAPNRFVINIQPDQRADVLASFAAAGLPEPRLEPMIRGRLVGINDTAVTPADFADERAQRLVDREFNLSWGSELPAGNTVTAGTWHGEARAPAFSVEQGLAETLGLKVGDRLDYQIAGRRLVGEVTSLRKLEWDSMRVNFFVIAAPGMLDDYPASYITSFHLPRGREPLIGDLLKRAPNLTVIDMGALLQQIQETLDQVIRAVQLIFGFALAVGLVVLFAALQASGDERRRELSILRALGARERQLTRAMLAEYVVLGGLTGFLGGVGASLIGWALARFAFHLDYLPNPQVWGGGLIVGVILVSTAGLLGMRSLLRQPAVEGLRAG